MAENEAQPQFTPGPWEVVPSDHPGWTAVVAGTDHIICNADPEDANVISASTDLYWACERLLVNFHAVLRGTPVRDAGETIAEAEAAMRKARGGSES